MLVLLAKLLLFPLSLLLLAAQPWEPGFPELEPQPERPCSSLAVYGDSTASYRKYQYDESLRLTRIQMFEGKDDTSPIKRIFEVSWDSTGLTETRREISRSGEPNGRVRVIIRDKKERIVEQYSLRDERIYRRESWTYNDAGLLVQHRKSETGGDIWDYGSDFEYDSQGRVTVEYYGLFPNRFPLRQWRVYYARDGLSAEVVRSRVSDDRVHSRKRLFFDIAGRLVREESPALIVGDRLSVTIWTYDNAGRLVQVEHANEQDVSRERVAYAYDDKGRLLQKLIFYKGSSDPNFSYTWNYGCWTSQ